MTSALEFKDSRSQNVSGTLDYWVHTGEMNLPSAETEIVSDMENKLMLPGEKEVGGINWELRLTLLCIR